MLRLLNITENKYKEKKMSNSSLVTIKVPADPSNYSKGRSGQIINKITIHHMAGRLTAAQCGAVFAQKGKNASTNYGVGYDGSIGLYVDENNRSWASSSPSNDNQAVTIEVSNDGGTPDWHVSDIALNKTIDLVADICKRNGIKQLNYTGNTAGNLTRHNMFTSTSCPGPYLQSQFPYIAEQVNKMLKGETKMPTETKEQQIEVIKQKAGLSDETIAFLNAYRHGDALLAKLAKAMT